MRSSTEARTMIPTLSLLLLARQQAVPIGPPHLGTVDVPLARLVGTPLFNSTGVAFLDYDADGWIDLYVNANAGLWRNMAGTTFVRVADLDAFLPPIVDRYGAACGDYDSDGLPDIAGSPRGDCFTLLRNVDGAGTFVEVAADPLVLNEPLSCDMFGESFCWADVDEDGDLDFWGTAYPDDVQPGSGGNQFLENLGPTGPGGAYRFARKTLESGLGNPPDVNRPEGAQFLDADRDGDVDGFANNTLYQNVTALEGPRFRQLTRQATGITLPNRLDEGTVFLDHDLDGDQDLFVVYRVNTVLWENEGDGTFRDGTEAIESPSDGATEGTSAEDWDQDGDMDLTSAGFFRRNLLVEEGEPFLRLATTSIPADLLQFCLPAWGDWDKDGDPDCALANFSGRGGFFRNTTYEPGTPLAERHSLRVRVLGDSDTVARGLESEFGATVEVRVQDDPRGFVRRRFVASSHGYLQQSEYALTFALPDAGTRFDLVVDFPSLPRNGILRVDRTINPALGDLALEDLAAREITVFRSGRVRIDGADHEPHGRFSARVLSSGALALPAQDQPLAEPEPAPAGGFVGLELDTLASDGPVLVAELVLDGQLAPAGAARCDSNVRLYDVTPGEPARLLRAESLATSARNHRSFFPLDWKLEPDRVYRVLCRVTALRASPLAATPGAVLANRGGLAGSLADPCTVDAALAVPVDAAQTFLELRYRSAAPAGRSRAR
jgi:VCBS repeat protein